MNGETNTETTQPPPKVEAPPKAEAPGVEKGLKKPSPLKPAETAILKITGEPGSQREDPRGALKLVAEAPTETSTTPPRFEQSVPTGSSAENPNTTTPALTPAINNQNLLNAISDSSGETLDNPQHKPLTETSTPIADNSDNDLLQKMNKVAGENAAIDIEAQTQQKAIEDINTKLTESGVPADKQDEINNALKENPQAAPDVAAELNNINTADKSEADAKIQQLKEEIIQLKQKLEQEQQLTPDEQDKLTKGTLVLAIIAAIIAGTFEGLKEGLEQSAQLK